MLKTNQAGGRGLISPVRQEAGAAGGRRVRVVGTSYVVSSLQDPPSGPSGQDGQPGRIPTARASEPRPGFTPNRMPTRGCGPGTAAVGRSARAHALRYACNRKQAINFRKVNLYDRTVALLRAAGAERLCQASFARQQAIRESALQHLTAKNVCHLPGPVGSPTPRIGEYLRCRRGTAGTRRRHDTKIYLSDPERGICSGLRYPAD